MLTYYDTGVLVKLYVPEAGSDGVCEFVAARGKALLITPLHDAEARNAFALKVFRREITPREQRGLLRQWGQDLTTGRLGTQAVDWALVFRRTAAMSGEWTPNLGCRTLDVMHVASALILGAREFVTLDLRQRRLAESVGLATPVPELT